MKPPRPRRASQDLSGLETALGYKFKDRALVMTALTHVSALSTEEGRSGSYQRLEYLGDRVLGLCVADMLLSAFPHADEGELSRRLADLVRKETCAEVAGEWGVSAFLKLGSGFVTAGRRNQAILGDVCEAIIGAVFLDSGFSEAKQLVVSAFSSRMAKQQAALRDAKSALQEWAQGQGLPLPVYQVIECSGPDHAPKFIMAAIIQGLPPAEAVGASKRLATHAAAEVFLRHEGAWVSNDT